MASFCGVRAGIARAQTFKCFVSSYNTVMTVNKLIFGAKYLPIFGAKRFDLLMIHRR